jgi:hypothetical protein
MIAEVKDFRNVTLDILASSLTALLLRNNPFPCLEPHRLVFQQIQRADLIFVEWQQTSGFIAGVPVSIFCFYISAHI